MSFSASDIKEIKWSLGAFVLSMGLAAALISYSQDYQHQALQDRQAAQQRLTEVRAKLATALSDQENMATYQLEYEALIQQKVIGDEQRLNWMEDLEKIRKQRNIPEFKYTIAPQQGYAPNPPLDSGNFNLYTSPMTLQINLLHEEQLLHLFTALNTQIQGWFILDRCSLSGIDAQGTGALSASCAGGWITMKNRNAP